jgi:hypothetical protein
MNNHIHLTLDKFNHKVWIRQQNLTTNKRTKLQSAAMNIVNLGLKMSRVESNSSELDSIGISSDRNSARVYYELFFQLEFGSFKVHEQFGSARQVQLVKSNHMI